MPQFVRAFASKRKHVVSILWPVNDSARLAVARFMRFDMSGRWHPAAARDEGRRVMEWFVSRFAALVFVVAVMLSFGCGETAGQTGACINDGDLAINQMPGFEDDLVACAIGAIADREDTAMCLVDMHGLSEECADCYGSITECSATNCITPCSADEVSQECRSCVADNCQDDFNSCTGFEPEAN